MSIVQAKAQAAKHRRQIGGVQLPLRGVIRRQNLCQVQRLSVFHHVLQREQASDIGFGLFDGAIKFFEFLARRSVASIHLDLVRAEAVHQFVGHDMSKK